MSLNEELFFVILLKSSSNVRSFPSTPVLKFYVKRSIKSLWRPSPSKYVVTEKKDRFDVSLYRYMYVHTYVVRTHIKNILKVTYKVIVNYVKNEKC